MFRRPSTSATRTKFSTRKSNDDVTEKLAKQHPHPYLRRGHRETPPPWRRAISKIAFGDCWQWTGSIRPDGYGVFPEFHTKNRQAHDFIYEMLVGPVPEGLVLDHLCRNRSCVNPRHLEPVTVRENLLRGDTFQARNSKKTHCPQGHPYSGDTLRVYTHPKGWKARYCVICKTEQGRRNSGKVG